MLKGLCLDTITIKNATVEEKISIAKSSGYQGIELRGNDLKEYFGRGGEMGRLRDLINESGLRIPAFVPESEYYGWHVELDSELNRLLDELFRLASGLQNPMMIFPVMSTDGDLNTTVRNFKEICHRAAEFNLEVCLEFIGHVTKVNDVKTAWEVVAEADMHNGGILVDVFHYYRGGSRLEDLKAMPVEKLFLIHLNDAMDLPVQELIGARHRLYPGDGVIPLLDLINVLKERNYSRDYVIEIFNPDYWASNPEEVARMAREKTAAIFKQI